jgi:ketosteroid isomerase-like protein
MAKKKATTRPTRKSAKKAKPTAASPPRADDAIRQLDAEFMKTANAKNAGALVKAFYARDAVLMPPNHPAVEGHADIGKFLQGMIDAGFADIKLETTTIASAGDLAYGQGHYELSMAPAGGAATQDVGKYIVVYRRQPSGGWRAIADIFNSDQAAH